MDEVREDWLHFLDDCCRNIFNPNDPRDTGIHIFEYQQSHLTNVNRLRCNQRGLLGSHKNYREKNQRNHIWKRKCQSFSF